MIRNTLQATKGATYSIDLPHAARKDFPTPAGTGFFVSADGCFITAAHVVTTNGRPDGEVRTDLAKAWLTKEARPGEFSQGMCIGLEAVFVDARTDVALLRANFENNKDRVQLKGRSGFPFVSVSRRLLEEAEPIYAFGYPLSESVVREVNANKTIGFTSHGPRVTSAIVASTFERSLMASTGAEPVVYVLDKALNYGNSGGPILAVSTGNVHAVCSRFQPVEVPQHHLHDKAGQPIRIHMPSLYGVVAGLQTRHLLSAFESNGVSLSDA